MFCFNSLSSSKNLLVCCTITDSNITQWKNLRSDYNSSLSLKPPNVLTMLPPENSNDPENISPSKFYDTDEIHNINIPRKNKSLSLFYINACSVNKILVTFNIF